MAKRLTPLVCIALGLGLIWAASGGGNPDAYVFPKLLATLMVVLGVAMAITDWGFRGTQDMTAVLIPWAELWPALLVFVLYMAAAQQLGFYFASWLAFAAIGVIYSPMHSTAASAKRCLPIALLFLAVLYGVFVFLLQVQTPKGVML